MLNSYLEFNFDILHAATNKRFAHRDSLRLVNLGPTALISNYKLRTSSGKDSENIDHAHIVSLMYEVITSNKRSGDLSIDFDRDGGRRQRELTHIKA